MFCVFAPCAWDFVVVSFFTMGPRTIKCNCAIFFFFFLHGKTLQFRRLRNRCFLHPTLHPSYLRPCRPPPSRPQHPSKIESFQKTCAINTLENSAAVLPMLLREGRAEFVDTVVLLLDSTKPLYHGSKTMWASLPGAPEVSGVSIERRFAKFVEMVCMCRFCLRYSPPLPPAQCFWFLVFYQ